MIDCGLIGQESRRSLKPMQERLGFKGIDAVLVTHMHGDHIVGVAARAQKWGAKLWTLDRVARRSSSPSDSTMPRHPGLRAGIDRSH